MQNITSVESYLALNIHVTFFFVQYILVLSYVG